MSLMKKLKPIAAGLMLSAAAMSCMTTTPWQTVRTDERPTGNERIETKDVGTKKMDTRTFDISDAYPEGEIYKTKITDSLKRETYNIQGKRIVKTVDKFRIEQRQEKRDIFNPIIVGLGTAGGLYAGAELGGKNGRLEGGLLGVLGGFLGGALIGGALNVSPITTKTETREAKIRGREVYSNQETEEEFIGESEIYTNRAGKIKFGRAGNNDIYVTGENGIIGFTNSEKNRAVTREGLEKKLYDIPLIREIKPETREKLRARLLEKISDIIETWEIETRETPSNLNEIVKNCSKELKFSYFQLKDEAIYNVVQQFVNEEINSFMRIIDFGVKDDLTHVPITGTNWKFSTDAPSKSELLGRYFTGGLKSHAEIFVLNYLSGKGKMQPASDNLEFTVYSPSNIFMEVTHPDYNFVSGEIGINKNKRVSINGELQKIINGDSQIPVYLADKGSKVRLQKAGDSTGRIGN